MDSHSRNSTPEKKIVAICEISRDADDKYIYIKKKESLGSPIDFSTIKEDPDLQGMEFFKNMNGSLFKLTKSEYETIMDLIREENPLPEKHAYKKYNKEDFLKEVFMSEADYDLPEFNYSLINEYRNDLVVEHSVFLYKTKKLFGTYDLDSIFRDFTADETRVTDTENPRKEPEGIDEIFE